MKSIAIVQSNYIPWKGYFDIIGQVDAFMFLDDVQYTKRDWRNRNLIKTKKGLAWLSVPCNHKRDSLICDVSLVESNWQKSHFNKIYTSYNKAPYFKYLLPFLELVYLQQKWTNLSELNQFVIKKICKDFLQIETEFLDSRNYDSKEKKMFLILDLVKKVGAKNYLSGPAAKNYIVEEDFLKEGINVELLDDSCLKLFCVRSPAYQYFASI